MADAILSVVADTILTQVASHLLRDIGLRRGVKYELEKLEMTVATVQAVLLDAEDKSSRNNEVKEWVGRLKQAFYEADDLLDDFSTEALRRKVMSGNKISKKMRTFFSLSSNQAVYGIKMAHRLRAIRRRLNKIAESRRFLLDERFPERSVVTIERETHSYPPTIVVGREDDKRVIMGCLLSADCEDGVGFIAIVGIGGIGKTTLAQLVFNDEKVKEYFELRLWVCVSDNFDPEMIIGEILGPERSEIMELNALKALLLEKIKGRRYLLVLDDVWNEDSEKWSSLTHLLVGGSRGSRVIVTTRLPKVADMTQTIGVHKIQGLSPTDSWELLKQMVFWKGQVLSGDHQKIGMEILKKCYGVPLAIRAIGGLLYFKESVAEWRAFEEKEIMKIDQNEYSILPVLEISYNHLPSRLKNCFVYCRLFPKDSRIDVPKLINCWIAQGFVKVSDETQCPMDVGLEYFMELSGRSFFQEVEKDEWGNISFCKMQGLMHDLATKLAGVESIMFRSVGDYNVDGRTLHASYLSDPYSPWKLPASLPEAGNLRTLLLLQKGEEFPLKCKIEEENVAFIISNFRRLRVLEVHDPYISKMPFSISKLKHLKHLDFSYNKRMKMLPNSITMLHNLLILILDGCSRLKELPRDMQNLVNLTQLSLEECDSLTHMPKGIGELASLYKLSRFVVAKNSFTTKHVDTLEELGKLDNLRGKLEIFNLGYVREATEFQGANMNKKQHLQELMLDWAYANDFQDVEGLALEALQPHLTLKRFTLSYYRGSKIPCWLSSLKNLEELRLDGCDHCQNLPPMHQLKNLKRLCIIDLHSLVYIDNESTTMSAIEGREESTSTTSPSSFFHSLETLELSDCPKLKGWWGKTPTPSSTFPCLSQLMILGCPEMTSMPLFPPPKDLSFGPGTVISLKEILNTSTAPMEACSSSSSAPTLSLAFSQLCKLDITSIEDLEFLPEDLAQSLCSLKTLSIRGCHGLKTLGQALQHLTSLEELKIDGCSYLNLFEEAMYWHWQALRSLCSLSIKNITTLEFFPSWFQEAMPSLRMLNISHCNNLKRLPERMGQLPSLQNLIIESCPQLSRRCGSNKCVDWSNVKSIPNITINRKVIQQNGHYMLSQEETNEAANVNQPIAVDGSLKLVELNKRVLEFALSFTKNRQFLRTACNEMLQRLRVYDDRCNKLSKKREELHSISNEVKEILEKSEEIEELFSGHEEKEVMTEKLRNSLKELKSAEKLLEELGHGETKQETKTMLAELLLRLSDEILPMEVKEKLNIR